MRVKALEIRWHETKPIFSTDFQPFPTETYTKHEHPMGRSASDQEASVDASKAHEGKAWRLATAGGDNHVRVWLVTPSPSPSAAAIPSSSAAAPSPARGKPDGLQPTVQYLATLSRHSAVVNVVRFSPNGMTLASAGDDGNVILWYQSDTPPQKGFGDNDDALYARETWKIRRAIRVTQQEIYDMAWSPDGEWLLVGSTDNTARIVCAADGSTAKEIADHNNYVQGVAWDPLNKYIATQSSDKHMHVYGLDIRTHQSGTKEFHINLVGKNSKMELQKQARRSVSSERSTSATPAPSTSKLAPSSTPADADFRPPAPKRSMSRASDSSDTSMTPSTSSRHLPDEVPHASTSAHAFAPLQQDDLAMNPPPTPGGRTTSRRSSFSGSQTAGSPVTQSATLPGSGSTKPVRAARSPSPMPPLPAIRMPPNSVSPNQGAKTAGLADLPAEQAKIASAWMYGGQEVSPFFRRLCWSTDGALLLTPAGLFEDPFAAGKAAAASGSKDEGEGANGKSSKKKDKQKKAGAKDANGPKPTVYIYSRANVARQPVAHLPGHKSGSIAIRFNPLLWTLRGSQPAPTQPISINIAQDTEASIELDKAPNPVPLDAPTFKGAFDLPYRMVYAVATHESVYVYDTQQAGPVCMFGNLHYAPFTDVAWTADGMSLVLASQDGYCSVVAFEAGELGEPCPAEEQPVRQVGSNDSRPLPAPSTSSLPPTPSSSTAAAPGKHPLDPAPAREDASKDSEGQKPKKRRVVLTSKPLE